jgi:hypothetical protein
MYLVTAFLDILTFGPMSLVRMVGSAWTCSYILWYPPNLFFREIPPMLSPGPVHITGMYCIADIKKEKGDLTKKKSTVHFCMYLTALSHSLGIHSFQHFHDYTLPWTYLCNLELSTFSLPIYYCFYNSFDSMGILQPQIVIFFIRAVIKDTF